jgi:molybdopterin-guanine dinucleotide biosynthesis protein A
MNVTGYILAGGLSSRMGRDKAFLKFGETTFLENAAAVLRPVCREVKAVFNISQKGFAGHLPEGVSGVFDIYEGRGPLGGIHTAFSDCPTEIAAVLAVDLPFVTTAAMEKLCALIAEEKTAAAFVPLQTDGRIQPLAAVYRAKKCLPPAEEILAKKEKASMRRFLETINAKFIKAGDLSKNADLFLNVNEKSEYEKLISKDHGLV